MSVRLWIGVPEQAVPYGDQPGYEQTWHADGSETDSAITAAIASGIPATLNGFPIINVAMSHKGAGFWDITLKYGLWTQTETLTGQVGGGTLHRTFSLDTVRWYDLTGAEEPNTPLFGNLIGVDGLDVKGVDIPDNAFNFTIKKKFLASALAADYIDDIRDLVNKTNDDDVGYVWRGQTLSFATGELVFRGMEFADGAADLNGSPYIEFNFKFEFSANDASITIGDITGISKDGWEYLWVLTRLTDIHNTRVKLPVAAYIEKVYKSGDYTAFGIFS